MRFRMDFSKLPKCGSQPKKNSSRTHPCRHIALKNGRCYYHQGRPPVHGSYTKVAYKERALNREYIIATRKSLVSLYKLLNEKNE